MRRIDLIVVHCSATRCNRPFTVRALIRCHAKGYNSHSLGVCYEGGYDEQGRVADTRTKAQKEALLKLLKKLKAEHLQAEIVGRRDLPGVKKACPCFDAAEEYKN